MLCYSGPAWEGTLAKPGASSYNAFSQLVSGCLSKGGYYKQVMPCFAECHTAAISDA